MKKNYTILSIDTSCDETSAAVTISNRVFSNVVSSQVELHKKYGGVVPILAQRAHRERINFVIFEALNRFRRNIKDTYKKSKIFDNLEDYMKNIDVLAVTVGPGLAPALEVGIDKARELAKKYKKPLIAVNHMEGHLLSSFAKNSRGKGGKIVAAASYAAEAPEADAVTDFLPLIGLLVSGGHTQLVLMKSFGKYKLLGKTLDDACGEAFDKIAKILSLGYPGGEIVEKLAKEGNEKAYNLPVPMRARKDLNFSFSGLKTAVLYLVKNLKLSTKRGFKKELNKKQISDICACFQKAATEHLVDKLKLSVDFYKPKGILLGGGVISNLYIRSRIRKSMKKYNLPIFIPFNKKLFTDNAAMIGVCAYFKAKRGEFVKNLEKLDRIPRLNF